EHVHAYTYRISSARNDSLFGNPNHAECVVLWGGRSHKLCAVPRFPHGRALGARGGAILADRPTVQNPGGELWTVTLTRTKSPHPLPNLPCFKLPVIGQ